MVVLILHGNKRRKSDWCRSQALFPPCRQSVSYLKSKDENLQRLCQNSYIQHRALILDPRCSYLRKIICPSLFFKQQCGSLFKFCKAVVVHVPYAEKTFWIAKIIFKKRQISSWSVVAEISSMRFISVAAVIFKFEIKIDNALRICVIFKSDF